MYTLKSIGSIRQLDMNGWPNHPSNFNNWFFVGLTTTRMNTIESFQDEYTCYDFGFSNEDPWDVK